jgi:Glycosyltransferase family 28 C-terminal domain/Monogalactosyldiacylglycerol (MGDG) synthase
MTAGDDRPELLVFAFDAGGGHRATANALLAAAEDPETPFRVTVVSLQKVLEGLDPLKRLSGTSLEGTYNALIREGRTRYLVPLLRVLHGATRLRHRSLVRRLAVELKARRPAGVLSVVPNFNAEIRDAVRAALPGAPFMVLLTDLADFPPHFWIEPGIDRVIVATREAEEQARAAGIPPADISRTSGMVLHPRFYPPAGREARTRVREELGIPDSAFAVLVLFGGKGSAEMEPLSAALLAADHEWHVTAVCGDNPALVERLTSVAAAGGGRLRSLGFTNRIADHLAAADVLVTKPGPGSLAEAFHQRVPVVVTCDDRTIPQERFNARFVHEQGLGLVVGDWRELPAAAARLARDGALRNAVQSRLEALPPNRAVDEVLGVVAMELASRREGPFGAGRVSR